jgi:hypothetical protein
VEMRSVRLISIRGVSGTGIGSRHDGSGWNR